MLQQWYARLEMQMLLLEPKFKTCVSWRQWRAKLNNEQDIEYESLNIDM